MRAIVLATTLLSASTGVSVAVISIDEPNQCSDRNSLQGMAYDARLVAIKMYYKGVIHELADKQRQTCLEARVLMDDRFAVINRTREIIETKCLPIDIAAGMATQDLCR